MDLDPPMLPTVTYQASVTPRECQVPRAGPVGLKPEFTVSLAENYVPDKALSFATVVVATASGETKLNAQVNVRIIMAEE